MNPVVAKSPEEDAHHFRHRRRCAVVVYFWNLDQKLMGWLYKQVNTMFDRKPTDIKF